MRLLSVLSVLLLVSAAFASDVVILDESNFDQVVDGSKNVLVEFFGKIFEHAQISL